MDAAAQGIVKLAGRMHQSVESGLASQWPRFGAGIVALGKNGSTRSVLSSHQCSGIGKKTTPCDDHRLGGKERSRRVAECVWSRQADFGMGGGHLQSRAARVPNFKVLGWADPVV